ncbi:hypothetical protein CASFOL_020898 [Castilleja foliolosa]|uniref:Uncharacterized protein n=1 Tax=Castilleja foliolosa TaxID=1961234 RepID=A0ABD3D262_9LAMI
MVVMVSGRDAVAELRWLTTVFHGCEGRRGFVGDGIIFTLS